MISYLRISWDALADAGFEQLHKFVNDALSVFECQRSKHLQDFARTGIKRYSDHGHSKTYVLLEVVDGKPIDVAAFFTVGLQSLSFQDVSNSAKKRLFGDFTYASTGAYLIAELARSDKYSSEMLPGEVILKEALDVIANARENVGGRFLMVDCQEMVFRALYEPNGFKQLRTANPPQSMPDVPFITAARLIKDL